MHKVVDRIEVLRARRPAEPGPDVATISPWRPRRSRKRASGSIV